MSFDFEKLSKFSIFSGISKEELPAMLGCIGGYQKNYQKDEIIFGESSEIKSAGLILSGIVHMVKEDIEGEHALLVAMKEGDVFGESFACGSSFYSHVSFFSAAPAQVLFLPFYRLIRSCARSCEFHHRLIENMVRLMGDKNVKLMQKIEIVSQKTIRGKLMVYLKNQAEQQGSKDFRVPMGRMELAEYLCADRSALSRELSYMKRDGLLWYEKNHFRLL